MLTTCGLRMKIANKSCAKHKIIKLYSFLSRACTLFSVQRFVFRT